MAPSLIRLCALASLGAIASGYTPTAHGVLVALPAGVQVELAIEGLYSFRVSSATGTAPVQVMTSMVSTKSTYAPFTVTAVGAQGVNLSAPFGSVFLDGASGAFALADANGTALARSESLISPAHRSFGSRFAKALDACAGPTCSGCDVIAPERSPNFANGTTVDNETACCAACNTDAYCASWVYATGAESPNCWPLARNNGTTPAPNRIAGGVLPPPPPPSTRFTLSGLSPEAEFLGSGTDGPGAQTLARSAVQAMVVNKGSWTPSFWCSGGFSALAVSPFEDAMDGTDGSNTYPVEWAVTPGGGSVDITVLGGAAGSPGVDLYLTPAKGLREHVAAQSALEGFAPVPPRYAMGFFACRWGWVNQSYIEGVLAEFRSGHFPADSMISDFGACAWGLRRAVARDWQPLLSLAPPCRVVHGRARLQPASQRVADVPRL